MKPHIAAAALAALAVAAGAGASPSADPGLAPTSILLGGTVPHTGEAASFGTIAAGARAYFDHVNAQGGVHGRKISYRTYDDAYNPALTVQLTRRLVEEDEVFAVFSSLGTATNLAVRDYLNERKVPQLGAEPGSAGQPVPAPGHPPAHVADRLPAPRGRLPVPLRQQGVGQGERVTAGARLTRSATLESG